MRTQRVLAALLITAVLAFCFQTQALAASRTAYSSTKPSISFSTRPTAIVSGNRKAYSVLTVDTLTGSISNASSVTIPEGTQVTVLGFSRFHHVFAKIEYYNPGKGAIQELWLEAAHMRPASRTITEQFFNDDGSPLANWPVRVVNGMGEEAAIIYTDENGFASYTGLCLNLDDAFAFAELMWSNETIGSGSLIENNDCATFVSELLTVGGFAVYEPYASRNTSRNPGVNTYDYGLFNQLTYVLGIPFETRPSDGTIDVSRIYPGDVAFMHPYTMTSSSNAGPYSHTVFVQDVDPETQQLLTFSHSGYWHEWKSVDDPKDAILAVVHTSVYHYSFEPLPQITLPEALMIPVGFPVEINFRIEPASMLAAWEWTVEPEGALRVEDGLVIADQPGSATLTLTANGISAECVVTAVVPSVLPGSLSTLEADVFSGVPMIYLVLPASLTDISDNAFDGCSAVLIVVEDTPMAQWVEDMGLPHMTVSR